MSRPDQAQLRKAKSSLNHGIVEAVVLLKTLYRLLDPLARLGYGQCLLYDELGLAPKLTLGSRLSAWVKWRTAWLLSF